MYPFLRMAMELWAAPQCAALGVTDTHVSYHRCWPQDSTRGWS